MMVISASERITTLETQLTGVKTQITTVENQFTDLTQEQNASKEEVLQILSQHNKEAEEFKTQMLVMMKQLNMNFEKLLVMMR